VASKGTRRSVDQAAVVEAIYDLSLSHDQWLIGLSRLMTRELDAALGSLTITFRRGSEGAYSATPLYVDTPPEIQESFPAVVAPIVDPDSTIFPLMMREPLSGMRETFPPDHPYRQTCDRHLARVGGVDTNLLVAYDTAAQVVSISPIFAREATPTSAIRMKYRRLAAHLSSAIRLRRRLTKAGNDAPDAIFDPAGRSHYACGDAKASDELKALRAAVRARERALASLRAGTTAEPLQLWNGMVSGRWSLLDRFESEGRRFVVALRNENIPSDPRSLTPREEQVAQLAGFGASNSRIAYALGVSAECVSAHLHSALRKLRCTGRRDLIRMLSCGNYAFTVDINGDMIGVIAEPPPSQDAPEALTAAERRVLVAIREGKTNAEIARRCGTSPRTVANQVASILRKTKLASRYQLMMSGKPADSPQQRPGRHGGSIAYRARRRPGQE
jgi:DNA-binding NarL/FixJ family response regulator